MKKIFKLLLSLFLSSSLSSCDVSNTIIVYTEAGFAPFEYVKDGQITGVDVDIMNLVGEKLNKKIVVENVNFDTIIDVVALGKLANVGAAGLSVTEERAKKVDFSTVYYEADLYVIYNVNNINQEIIETMSDGQTGIYFDALNTEKGIGVQTGTTADLFLTDEIAEGGSLEGVKRTGFLALDTAVSDIGLNIDYVIIDELPAKKLAEGKSNLATLPLYFEGEDGDELACDSYAIAVTKGQTKLLNAINEVLEELINDVNEDGNGIDRLINKHLGI